MDTVQPKPTHLDLAVAKLAAHGDLDREQAGRLLDSWQFSPELTGRERDAILDRFPGRCAHCGEPIELAVPAPPGPRVWRHSDPTAPRHGWAAIRPRTAS